MQKASARKSPQKGTSKNVRWIILAIVLILLAYFLANTLTGGTSSTQENTNPRFYSTAFSLLPPLLAIALALITKEVFSSLFIGIIVGAILYADGNLEIAYQTMLYHPEGGLVPGIANLSHAGILVFAGTTFMLVAILNRSGSVAAFGRFAQKHIHSRVGAQLASIFLGCLIFVDDGFNCLTVGSVMHPITDRFKISRAKLAYIIDSTAAPVCIIAPISSWAAAVASTVPESMNINGFTMFIRIIPYNLYALVTLFMMVLLVILKVDYGPMKRYEDNAKAGDIYTVQTKNTVEEIDDGGRGHVINLLLPVGVLIVTAIICMLYTGGFFSGVSAMMAFADCDAARALVMASFISLVFTFVLYQIQDIMSAHDFMRCIPEGLQTMCEPMIILILSWNLSGMTQLLGAGSYIHDLVESGAASLQMFLPFMIFLISVGLSFASGTSWGTFTILIPIICAVFPENMAMLQISIAACLSGSICGDHCSPISDTTILSSAGAGCDHVSHVSTQLPYALTAAAVSSIGFLLSGILGYHGGMGIALLATPMAFFVLIVVVLFLRKKVNTNKS